MDEIIASKFYNKPKLITCLPRNCFDSEGSSNTDDDVDGVSGSAARKKKKKKKVGCVVPEMQEEESDSENESEYRWPRNDVEPSDVVVSASDSEAASASLNLTSDFFRQLSTSAVKKTIETFCHSN